MILLLDSSVLIALGDDHHLAHDKSKQAMLRYPMDSKIATCAITQLALLRYLVRFRNDLGMQHSVELLRQFTVLDRHIYLPHDVQPVDGNWYGVIGHAQVTDAYLAHLARTHKAKLLTADRCMAALHNDVAELI